MIPGEQMLSGRQVRDRLAQRRGNRTMEHGTLERAITRHGLPWHPNPFGKGKAFFWSEIEDWLASLKPRTQAQPQRRGPGRPRTSF